MPFLTIGGSTFEVGDAEEQEPVLIGASTRSDSGMLRSTVKAVRRVWSFRTGPITEAQFNTARALVGAAVFLPCTGDAFAMATIECEVRITSAPYIRDGLSHMRVINFRLEEVGTPATPYVAVDSVVITPDPIVVAVGGTNTATIRTYDASMNELTGRTVSASLPGGSVATVLPASGPSPLVVTLSGVAEGSVTLTATSESESDTATVTVPAAAMFKYVPGDSLAIFTTKTRASAASYRDNNGVLQTVASDVMRDSHYIGAVGAGVRTLLVERGGTNQAPDFYMTGSVDGAGTAVSASGHNGMLPSSNTRLVASNTASSSEHWYRQYGPAVASGDCIAAGIFAKYRDASARYLMLLIQPPGNHVTIDLTNGAVIFNAGNYLVDVEPWADGYWRIRATTLPLSGAGTAQVQLRYAASAGDVNPSVIPIGEGFYATGFQMEIFQRQALCSSPIITTGVVASRAADSVYRAIAVPVASMSMFVDFIDMRQWNGPSVDPLFVVGNTSMHGSNRLAIGEAGSNIYAQYRSGGVQREFSATLTPLARDRVRAVGALSGAGAWSGAFKKNTDADVPGGPVTEPLPGAWDGGYYFMGYAAFRKVVVALGVKTLAEMDAL